MMETEAESHCCTEEVPADYFDEECVTLNSDFASVCLHEEVLKATLGDLNNMRRDRMNNESDQCVMLLIEFWFLRDSYPEENMIYTPFQDAKGEITASLR